MSCILKSLKGGLYRGLYNPLHLWFRVSGLNSLKGVVYGMTIGVIKGDSPSVDIGSYNNFSCYASGNSCESLSRVGPTGMA